MAPGADPPPRGGHRKGRGGHGSGRRRAPEPFLQARRRTAHDVHQQPDLDRHPRPVQPQLAGAEVLGALDEGRAEVGLRRRVDRHDAVARPHENDGGLGHHQRGDDADWQAEPSGH